MRLPKLPGSLCESYNRQCGEPRLSLGDADLNLYGPHDNTRAIRARDPGAAASFPRGDYPWPKNAPDVVVWGSGVPMREFLHVDDMAAASIHVMELIARWQENTEPMLSHINVGTGVDCTIRELAQTIAQVVATKDAWCLTPPNRTARRASCWT